MINRALFVGAAALLLSGTSLAAQGRQQKQVVIPKSVLKTMIASKPRTKAPLGARAGIVLRRNVVGTKPANAGPTSVKQIKAPIIRN